jgi:hypothetical protein
MHIKSEEYLKIAYWYPNSKSETETDLCNFNWVHIHNGLIHTEITFFIHKHHTEYIK